MLAQYFQCNGREDCKNTAADEQYDCPAVDEERYKCKDNKTGLSVPISKICDKTCDCWSCDDESYCNGVKYGMMCERRYGEYAFPSIICDNIEGCLDKTDEINCTTSGRYCTIPPSHELYSIFTNGIRYLREDQICASFHVRLLCSDGLDQVNCTDTERVAMSCTLAGFPTNISIFAVCKGYPLCDDDYNNKCLEPEGGCILHKSSICDGEIDCPGGADETKTSCGTVSNTVKCTRRVAKSDAKGIKITHHIPLNWVFDGEVDCEDGEDETEGFWRKCGSGLTARYLDKGKTCSDQMKCPKIEKLVNFEELCDKIETCGGENEVCETSRGTKKTWNRVVRVSGKNAFKGNPVCLEGLESLKQLTGMCHEVQMSNSKASYAYFSKASFDLTLPLSKIDCSFTYGENYVYHACTDLCLPITPCPLKAIPHDTCVNRVKDKVFAITISNELTVLLRRTQESEDGPKKVREYHNELYPCNNKNCVLYSEVCNLVDDCGDGSDEVNCTNHFHCPGHDEYIPLSSKCDGHVDCRDYHDECNSDCDSSEKFIKCGYSEEELNSAKETALSLNREQILGITSSNQPPVNPPPSTSTTGPPPRTLTFVMTYSCYTEHVKNLINSLKPDILMLTGTDNIIIANRKNPNTSSLLYCKSSFSNILPEVKSNQKCSTTNCKSCHVLTLPRQFSYNDLKVKLDFSLNCKSDNVIYVARCNICLSNNETQLYFGQTCNRFNVRLNGHRACFKTENFTFEKSALSMHIFTEHVSNFNDKLRNFSFGVIQQVAPRNLDRAEDFYIFNSRSDILGLNRYKVCN